MANSLNELTAATQTALVNAHALDGNPHIPAGFIVPITSSVTFTKPISFGDGAMLKPSGGVTVTIAEPMTATGKVFDLSLTGLVAFLSGARASRAQWWGYVADAVTDCTAALQAASDAVYAAGGGVVEAPTGVGKLSGLVGFKSGVSLRGQNYLATIFRATAAAAQLLFYDTSSSGQRRGTSGEFTFDGNGIAELGVRVQDGANIHFQSMRSWNSKIDVSLDGLQNSGFTSCYFLSTGTFTDICLKIDMGSQHIGFTDCTFKDATLATIYITQSLVAPVGKSIRPEHITFDRCVTERATSNIGLLIDAGLHIYYNGRAINGITGNPVVVRRRVTDSTGAACHLVNLTLNSTLISAGDYCVDARATNTAAITPPVYKHEGVTATATWATNVSPTASAYPVAVVRLLGPTRQGVNIGVVLADQGVDVDGNVATAQSNKPLVVAATGSTKTRLDHSIYGHNSFTQVFSGVGTGILVPGKFVARVEYACELLSTTLSTVGAPSSAITADVKRGNAGVYETTLVPTLGTTAEESVSLTAKTAQYLMSRGDRIKVDVTAPVGKEFTIGMWLRRT